MSAQTWFLHSCFTRTHTQKQTSLQSMTAGDRHRKCTVDDDRCLLKWRHSCSVKAAIIQFVFEVYFFGLFNILMDSDNIEKKGKFWRQGSRKWHKRNLNPHERPGLMWFAKTTHCFNLWHFLLTHAYIYVRAWRKSSVVTKTTPLTCPVSGTHPPIHSRIQTYTQWFNEVKQAILLMSVTICISDQWVYILRKRKLKYLADENRLYFIHWSRITLILFTHVTWNLFY